MSLEKEKIQVDYTQPGVPKHVSNFMPDVYRDGDEYFCVLGCGETAITASGNSVNEAMDAWEKAYTLKQDIS